jgi:prevent-host-death family protein
LIIDPDEFVSARDASRQLGKLIDRLEAGEVNKLIIVDRNRPRAVVLTIAAYEELVQWPSADGPR